MKIFLKLIFLALVLTQGYTQSYTYNKNDVLRLAAFQSKDSRQDFIQYERACASNDGMACFLLGSLYYQGIGVKQDYQEAFKYFQKACDLGSSVGCREFKRLQKQLSQPKK